MATQHCKAGKIKVARDFAHAVPSAWNALAPSPVCLVKSYPSFRMWLKYHLLGEPFWCPPERINHSFMYTHRGLCKETLLWHPFVISSFSHCTLSSASQGRPLIYLGIPSILPVYSNSHLMIDEIPWPPGKRNLLTNYREHYRNIVCA